MKRNGFIDVWRVLFACLVAGFHFFDSGSGKYPLGKIGVEFFVILAGFLMYAGYSKHVSSSTLLDERCSYWKSYMVKRYFRFFWNQLFAFIFAFVIIRVIINGDRGLNVLTNRISGDIWEILLVKLTGLNRDKHLLNGVTWTLSAMLIAEFFIMGILVRGGGERLFVSFLMPLTISCGLGYWMNMEVAGTILFTGLVTFGVLRVYILLCFGMVAYILCTKLNRINFTKAGIVLLSLFEIICFIAVFWIGCVKNSRNWQFCCIGLLVLAFSISFSNVSLWAKLIRKNSFTNFLAEFSMGLYLTHEPINALYRLLYPNIEDKYPHEVEFFLICTVVAVAYTLFMRAFFKLYPKAKNAIQKVIIVR